MAHEELIALTHDNEQRSKSNTYRIDKLEEQQKQLSDLVSAVAVLAERQNQIGDDVNSIKRELKSLTEKPAKRWDSIMDKIISTIIAAIMGYALARIGLS